MKMLRQKYVGRNSTLVSQKQSCDGGMSQSKHIMTTYDTKVELVAMTMKWLETCHSIVTCRSYK